MKIKITRLLAISLIICQAAVFSQQSWDGEKGVNTLNESVYIHFNSALLLSGERLYYKIYCLNEATKKLSSLSKIAYVELVGENKKTFFKHKLKLKNGVGQGDFKISAKVPSGNYKIIGYTQWMRNGEKTSLFYDNITILNPYRADQQVFMQKKGDQSLNESTIVPKELSPITSEFLKINLTKKIFKKRAKVSFTLTSNTGKKNVGDFSISVKKTDAIDALQPKKITSTFFKKRNTVKTVNKFKDVIFLPELRGEIISGILLNKKNNQPISGKKVAFSIQQKNFILKISTTNNKGRFYFNLIDDYTNKNAVVQVLNENNTYKFIFDTHKPILINRLNFGDFKISEKYNKSILKRSIYNQIENSYLTENHDSAKSIESVAPFLGRYDIVYNLDDYTRFPTVKETFVEIIKNVNIVAKNNDEFEFRVESLDPYLNNKEQVAVIVDGILLQKYSKLMEYNARGIRKISIARTDTKFVVGTKLYDGFIVIETFKEDFKKEETTGYFTNVNLFKPEPIKKYIKRIYNNKGINNRIPDFRSQLLWEPMIDMITKKVTVDFFTSDNVGTYEISVEGFTKEGNPVTLKEYFIVK
jgi:hypothetical protein